MSDKYTTSTTTQNPLPNTLFRKSWLLKIALFATGLSGIVAEYILSTLASYFLGDSTTQWTLILSFMLFAMGLGSRLSKNLTGDLLVTFIFLEFLLSLLVAFSALTVYTISSFTIYNGLIIYVWSILVGLMIGLEIPIVARLNEQYEELRVNIASVMEHDYYGSLAGGLFFAFIGLPRLGLTYTPFVLGLVNFSVAMWLFFYLRNTVSPKGRLYIQGASFLVLTILVSGAFFAKPIIFFAEQARYKDQVVFEQQTKYQKLVLTQWKNHHWLFINGSQQFSTLDEAMYHEPLVHPVMALSPQRQNILVMGGGDGLAVREILKYKEVQRITLVDLDPAMTDLGKNHPVLRDVNKDAMRNPKLKILNQDGYTFLANTNEYFDVIIIDLPDPRTIELGRLYSKEFYQMCYKQLRPNGLMITQSGSPYYSTRAFECIKKTIETAGFSVAQLHAQILTLGEWGWTIGAKTLDNKTLKNELNKLKFDNIHTQWLNGEAMQMMTSFGKKSFFLADSVEINTIHNPVLPNYYIKGSWDLY